MIHLNLTTYFLQSTFSQHTAFTDITYLDTLVIDKPKRREMPEYFDQDADDDHDDPDNDTHTIPNLFPAKLVDTCLTKVQDMVFRTGVRVEDRARRESALVMVDQDR